MSHDTCHMTHDSTSDVTRAGRVTRRYVTRKVVPVSGPGAGRAAAGGGSHVF